MAYIKKLEDEKKHEQQQISGGPTETIVQGTSTPQRESAIPQQAQQPTSSKQSSSGMRFADLHRYVQANKPQTQTLTQKVSSGIEEEADKDIGKVQTQSLDTFREQVQSKQPQTQDFEQAKATVQQQSIIPRFNQQIAPSRLPQEIAPSRLPQEIAPSRLPQEIAPSRLPQDAIDQRVSPETLKQLRDFSYTGPTQVDDSILGILQGAVDTAQGRAGLLRTPEGRRTLLRDVVGNERYTTGMSALDQMLLQVDPTARSTLESVADRINKKYGSAVDETISKSRDIVRGEQERIAGEQAGLESVISEELNRARGTLTAAEQARENELIEQSNRINEFIKSKNLSTFQNIDLSSLGIDQTALQNIAQRIGAAKALGVDFDVSDFVKAYSPDYIREDVKTSDVGSDEERARIAALENLIGAKESMLGNRRTFDPGSIDAERLMRHLEGVVDTEATSQAIRRMYDEGLLKLERELDLPEHLLEVPKSRNYYETTAARVSSNKPLGESEKELFDLIQEAKSYRKSRADARRRAGKKATYELSAEEIYLLDKGLVKPSDFRTLNKVETGKTPYFEIGKASRGGSTKKIYSDYSRLPSGDEINEIQDERFRLAQHNQDILDRNQVIQEWAEKYNLGELGYLDPVSYEDSLNSNVIDVRKQLQQYLEEIRKGAYGTVTPQNIV